MNRFKILQSLIASLSQAEKHFCRQYLKVFNSGEEINRKTLQLFNLLCHKNTLSEKELCKVLYSKGKTNSFERNQVRLRDKILDALTIEQNLRCEGKRNERNIQRILLRRKLNNAEILINRKQYDIAQNILEAIEETAEKLELFDETLASLRLQLQLANSRNDFDKAEHLQLDIFYCCKRIFAITTAQNIISIIRANPSLDISERLQKLNENEREAPSITFSFFLIGINIQEAQQKGNYKAVETLLTRQLVLVSNYQELKERQLIGEIYLELAKNSLQLGMLEKAKEYLIDADHFLDENVLLEEREQITNELLKH